MQCLCSGKWFRFVCLAQQRSMFSMLNVHLLKCQMVKLQLNPINEHCAHTHALCIRRARNAIISKCLWLGVRTACAATSHSANVKCLPQLPHHSAKSAAPDTSYQYWNACFDEFRLPVSSSVFRCHSSLGAVYRRLLCSAKMPRYSRARASRHSPMTEQANGVKQS